MNIDIIRALVEEFHNNSDVLKDIDNIEDYRELLDG